VHNKNTTKSIWTGSPLGLGLAALGRPGYINLGHAEDLGWNYSLSEMTAQAHHVMDAAYAAGIRYFDAARSYGKAESFLASWIAQRNITPGELTIASKWGYTYTADWQITAEAHEVKEHSLPRLQQQWSETQHILGQHLSLYQIHSATLESGVLDNHEVLNELHRKKNETGVAMGVSVSGAAQPDIIRKAAGITVDGARLFDTIQATWNLLESSAGEALQEASDAGCFIIVKEALANGRLTDRNTQSEQLDTLRAVATELGASLDQLALATVCQQPWCGRVLSGAASVAHLQSNMDAVKYVESNDWNSALNTLTEAPEVYWATRQALAWN
jgi:aryl-alcohol dehydrogenase-like predicted oxidoreductase